MFSTDEYKRVFKKYSYISMGFYYPHEFDDNGKLVVVFKNGLSYTYIDVPESLWHEFTKSEMSADRVLNHRLNNYVHQTIVNESSNEFTYDYINEALSVFIKNWNDITFSIIEQMSSCKNKRYVHGYLKFIDNYEVKYSFDNSRDDVSFYKLTVFFKLDFIDKIIKLEMRIAYDKIRNLIFDDELYYNNHFYESDNPLIDQDRLAEVKDNIGNFIAEDFE